jgi:hypothetical protein
VEAPFAGGRDYRFFDASKRAQASARGNVAYVIDIAQVTSRGPHQRPEHTYYKRNNFKAEAMAQRYPLSLHARGKTMAFRQHRYWDLPLDKIPEFRQTLEKIAERGRAGKLSRRLASNPALGIGRAVDAFR